MSYKSRAGEVNSRGALSRNNDAFVWLIQSEVVLQALWGCLLGLTPGQVMPAFSRCSLYLYLQIKF